MSQMRERDGANYARCQCAPKWCQYASAKLALGKREKGGLAHVRQMSQAPARVRLLTKFDSSPALSSASCTGRVYCYRTKRAHFTLVSNCLDPAAGDLKPGRAPRPVQKCNPQFIIPLLFSSGPRRLEMGKPGRLPKPEQAESGNAGDWGRPPPSPIRSSVFGH